MTVNKKSPDRDQKNHLWLHSHTTMSLDVGLKKTLLILLEDYFVPLMCLGCPGLKRMFSDPDLLRNFDCSICDWEYEIFTFHCRLHFLFIEPSGVEF